MSRANSNGQSPLIYVLAVVVISLIIYILLLLFPIDVDPVPLVAEKTRSQEAIQYVKKNAMAELPFKKRNLDVRSLIQTREVEYRAEPERVRRSDLADTGAALQNAETATERSARSIRETLGIKEQQPSQAAVLVELMLSEGCVKNAAKQTILPIWYRFESPTIRTSSVNELRSLVSQFRLCQSSEFHLTQTALTDVESNIELVQLRFNELKYFFTQSNVPKSALHYPENP